MLEHRYPGQADQGGRHTDKLILSAPKAAQGSFSIMNFFVWLRFVLDLNVLDFEDFVGWIQHC